MNIEKTNRIGKINFSLQAVADLSGMIVSSVYGVVGLVNRKNVSKSVLNFLKKDNYSEGVVVKKNKSGYEISLYVVLSFDVKIAEVVSEIQKQVAYNLKKSFGVDFKDINVYVQSLA